MDKYIFLFFKYSDLYQGSKPFKGFMDKYIFLFFKYLYQGSKPFKGFKFTTTKETIFNLFMCDISTLHTPHTNTTSKKTNSTKFNTTIDNIVYR